MRRSGPVVPLRFVLLLAAIAMATATAAWRASDRSPLPPSLEGPCALQARVEPGGVIIDPARSGGVVVIPTQGTVSYRSELAVAPSGMRQVRGEVRVDLPPPFSDLVVGRWDEPGALAANEGSATYDLGRWWAPVGATVRITAEHAEPGLNCRGWLVVRLGGQASVLRPLAVLVLVASTWLTARAAVPSRRRRTRRPDAGDPNNRNPWAPEPRAQQPSAPEPAVSPPRGRPVFGLLAGGLTGLATSVVLLLSGALLLSSLWVVLVPLLGLAAGLASGLRPLRRGPPDERDDTGEHAVAADLPVLTARAAPPIVKISSGIHRGAGS